MSSTWHSRRTNALGIHGAVSSDQPAASKVGCDTLKNGGSAADAAVAMGAVLGVVQPSSCGIGGDMWILYYENSTKKVHCVNGTGYTPRSFTTEKIKELGYLEAQPQKSHPVCVSVPGAVGAWCDFHTKFGSGKSDLIQLFNPAIDLARNGFPVSDNASFLWRWSYGDIVSEGLTFPKGFLDPETQRPPKPGKIMRFPDLARSYEEIGNYGKKAFYEGRIAREIVECLSSKGGLLTLEDLASQDTLLTEAISVPYTSKKLGKTFRILETPLNSQAIVTLESLKILEALGVEEFIKRNDRVTYFHAILEALKLSFEDLAGIWQNANNSGPSQESAQHLLSEAYAKERSKLIDMNAARNASTVLTGPQKLGGDTTYFCVVDKEGNACSVVYSTYSGFGTPWVPQGCGFTLHNRNLATWEFGGGNFLPRIRPFHTLCAGMIASDDLEHPELLGVFGCMGGQNQPQGHLQVLLGLLELGLSPQEALDQSRVMTLYNFNTNHSSINIEDGVDAEAVKSGLQAKGHNIEGILKGYDRNTFGRGHVITRGNWWDAEGRNSQDMVWWAGCDPRSDGVAFGLN